MVAVIEFIKDSKMNQINLESEYFKDIYKDHLVYKIPTARKYIKFSMDNELEGTDKLIEELQQIRQESLYFQYNNAQFYDKLKGVLQNLEDYLVNNAGKKFVGEEQTQVYNYIKNAIDEIYKIISDGFLGRRQFRKPHFHIEWH